MTETQPWAPPNTAVNRVPDDLPYVVRPNGAGYAAIFGSAIAFLLVLPILALVWLNQNLADEASPADMYWALWFSALANAAIVAFLWWIVASGGPRLAMNREGVWLRGGNRPMIRVHFLHWEQVGEVWLDGKRFLCLRPRDPDLVSGWRGLAGVEARAAIRRRGAPFAVPLGKHCDRPDRETREAVWHFSAGRIVVRDTTQ